MNRIRNYSFNTQEFNMLMNFMGMARARMDESTPDTFPELEYCKTFWEALRKKLVEDPRLDAALSARAAMKEPVLSAMSEYRCCVPDEVKAVDSERLEEFCQTQIDAREYIKNINNI